MIWFISMTMGGYFAGVYVGGNMTYLGTFIGMLFGANAGLLWEILFNQILFRKER